MLPNEVRGGYQVDGDADKIVTLVRLAAEMGADIIKADPTSDPDDFHRVIEAARVPVLVRGGGKEDLRTRLRQVGRPARPGRRGPRLRPQHLPAREPEARRRRPDGDDPPGRLRRRGLGDLPEWLSPGSCSASTPATPSSRRCSSTARPPARSEPAQRRLARAGARPCRARHGRALGQRRRGDPRLPRQRRRRPGAKLPRSAAPAMATASTCSTATARRCSRSSRSTCAPPTSPTSCAATATARGCTRSACRHPGRRRRRRCSPGCAARARRLCARRHRLPLQGLRDLAA